MKKPLTRAELISTAEAFCLENHAYPELFGVTDGKAVGTFIEKRFQQKLESLYTMEAGSSALGLDLPSEDYTNHRLELVPHRHTEGKGAIELTDEMDCVSFIEWLERNLSPAPHQ